MTIESAKDDVTRVRLQDRDGSVLVFVGGILFGYFSVEEGPKVVFSIVKSVPGGPPVSRDSQGYPLISMVP